MPFVTFTHATIEILGFVLSTVQIIDVCIIDVLLIAN